MLSLDHCRQLLGRDVAMTEAEIERLRAGLYELARVVVDEAVRRRQGPSKDKRSEE